MTTDKGQLTNPHTSKGRATPTPVPNPQSLIRAFALGSVFQSNKPTYSREEFLDKLEVRGFISAR